MGRPLGIVHEAVLGVRVADDRDAGLLLERVTSSGGVYGSCSPMMAITGDARGLAS